ncbi:MAG TPA: copper resistance protein B [Chloroflexota bacterium]|nr:copper resistance protein B [Chloroflexota bacterium]
MNIRYPIRAAGQIRGARQVRTALLTCVLLAGSAYGQSTMLPMQGMDHGGMDHGAMPGMQGGSRAGPATNAPAPQSPSPAQKTYRPPDLRPSRDYPRNPDGSIPIPGVGMAMADNDVNYMVLFDQLEYVRAHGRNGMAWDAQAWFGRDYDKIWFKSEGEQIKGAIDGRVEGLWSHAFAAFWDWQLGVRHDFGQSPSRQWLAFGVQGTAPYWFDVEATGYAGPGGRSAVRLKTEYTFRLSQVTFLSPELEANAYGKSDPARGIASGLSDVSLGLRLRYEIRREVAPYIGVAWTRKLGNTADLSRRAGEYVSERQVVAGVRIWF